jgi:uncharacterized phage protein gp47/JayE
VIYFCAQKNRREKVLQVAGLNGIDYLEVLGPPGCGRQLAVTFLKDATSLALTPANITVTGDTTLQVVSIDPATVADPLVVTINLDKTGDFAPYTFAIVAGAGITDPPDGIDPQLASVTFSFKAGCPSPADCLPVQCCPSPLAAPPDINYLAKDYDGFRQVMLDRLAVTTPTWTETHAADLGITLVEALAYAADHLSYQQDAVSTEAYLDTARSRISLRRHARLVDYFIGEGCNARTVVVITTGADLTLPAGTQFYVRVPGLPPAATTGDPVAQQLAQSVVSQAPAPVFTSLRAAALHVDLNTVNFYAWGDTTCCLPVGATEATLTGTLTDLQPGGLLVFEEVAGPLTGAAQDANPAHRCAVLLSTVTTKDYKNRTLKDPLTGTPITRITWAAGDALTFPLCVNSITDAEHGSVLIPAVSVARGNTVLADHGLKVSDEPLAPVPPLPRAPDPSASCSCGTDAQTGAAPVLPRYFPNLSQSPLTFSVPFDGISSAAAFLAPDSSTAVPDITVSDGTATWHPERDLLTSSAEDDVFVPEIEQDGTTFLRFGDDQHGAAAETGMVFTATYRVGNGSAGNVAAEALAHAVLPTTFLPPLSDIQQVRNPLAATGGIDPETMQHIRQFAPFAYQTQERCVTEADYGQMASQFPGVSEARGTLRWTGSWYTAFVTLEPSAATLTSQVISSATTQLNMLRMMGTDIAVEAAVLVGLVIELDICVDPAHFQRDVYQALMQIFITGDQCDGAPGLLNPDRFTFGETVYASPLIAAAQAVDGVVSATLNTFSRMDQPWVDGVALGYLTMGRLEIPRCDNDPDHLDHGTFTLILDGGK